VATLRTVTVAAAVLGALAPGQPAFGDAAERTAGRCSPGNGVTVVVDYGPLGAPGGERVQRGCDPAGADVPAATVIARAGFPVTYATGQPFICRIDGRPSPAEESCARTPPQDAYWGLFWADPTSGGWEYSTSGAATLVVPEGGALGLRFQDGGEREEPSAEVAGAVGERPAERVDAVDPGASSEREPEDGTTLALVAGAIVLLAGAAGVLGRRRRS
jgi:LPXTG-motif cell wall-anchored protein